MHLLEKEKVAVDFHDPYIDEFMGKKSVKLGVSLTKYDLIIIVVAHKGVDYNKLASVGIPILDTKDIYHDFSLPHIYSFFSRSGSKRNKKIKASLTAKV